VRILQLHSDQVVYTPVAKEIKMAEEAEKKENRVEDVVLLLTAVEEGDDTVVAEKAINDVCAFLGKLKVNRRDIRWQSNREVTRLLLGRKLKAKKRKRRKNPKLSKPRKNSSQTGTFSSLTANSSPSKTSTSKGTRIWRNSASTKSQKSARSPRCRRMCR
jgi:Mg-chelatase subunit ChlI